jgi:ribosomal protein S3
VGRSRVGRVIGRGGTKIREIQDQTNTRIQVYSFTDAVDFNNVSNKKGWPD